MCCMTGWRELTLAALCATRVVSPLQLDTLGIAALSTALEGMAKLQTLNMSCNSIEAEAMVR